MDRVQLEKAFDPYFTTRKGNPGLGLSKAKRALAMNRATLNLESQSGQGTTATLRFSPRNP